jgi:hypothetical protein
MKDPRPKNIDPILISLTCLSFEGQRIWFFVGMILIVINETPKQKIIAASATAFMLISIFQYPTQ